MTSGNIIIPENSSFIIDKIIALKNANLKNPSVTINITGGGENSGNFTNERTEQTPFDNDYYNIRFSNTTENDIDINFFLNDYYKG